MECNEDGVIVVIGTTEAGPAGLPDSSLGIIDGAELLVGGRRHLALFAAVARSAERWPIGAGVDELAQKIAEERRRVVVLASGDPGFYGIGAALRRALPAQRLRILPAVTAVQLAFAAISEPWQDAVCVSAHGRPSDAAIKAALHHSKVAVLTDGDNTPAALAKQLLDAGAVDCRAVVGERLGGDAARVSDTRLSCLPGMEFGPLNVMLILRDREGSGPPAPDQPFGIEEEELDHRAGMITKLEVRAAALARLRLRAGSVAWDVGAGSGSVSLEMARLCPEGRIFAVDRAPDAVDRIRSNTRRFGALVHVDLGEAPKACRAWPDPDAVFVGGGGADLPSILEYCTGRIRSDGRIVAAIATLETLQDGIDSLRRCGFAPHVAQVSVSRDQPVAGRMRLAASNPVFILWGARE